MRTYTLRIATPEGTVFADQAEQLILRGANGDLAVRAGHIPMMTTIRPCVCHITLPTGETRYAEVSEGLLTVGKKQVIVLLSRFEWTGQES